MVAHKAHESLFSLAFSNDDSIRYYALLAIAALSVNNNEPVDAAGVKSGTIYLVEPFVRSHDPIKFGKSDYAHATSKDWLCHLVPLLRSKREQALNIAAFHFAMEASILKEQGKLEVGTYT